MNKNILVLLGCLVIAGLAWGFFHIFGQWAFAILLTIPLLSLFLKKEKPKFGGDENTD